ncbi:helicase-related protein [Paenibacillus glycanilyticus]|uniref:helicase-related protein n=1 Tax=Paenibacillus glycanilyticus TaxID=126569 RepID=UPI003EBEDE70
MNSDLKRNLENRDLVYNGLRREFIGPSVSSNSSPLDCKSELFFESKEDLYKPYRDKNSGQEILQEQPSRRYGAAVLYPYGIGHDENGNLESPLLPEADKATFVNEKDIEVIETRNNFNISKDEEDSQELDISSANEYQQSSMAISFRAKFIPNSELKVLVTGGRYNPLKVSVRDDKKVRKWWVRTGVSIQLSFTAEQLNVEEQALISGKIIESTNVDGLQLHVQLLTRPSDDGSRLVTISLVNRSEHEAGIPIDSVCFFQSHFSVEISHNEKKLCILPYPEMQDNAEYDEEEQSLALLYRDMKTYAIGHGCSADWEKQGNNVIRLWTEFLPSYETKSLTPDIKRADGSEIHVSMSALAGLEVDNNGLDELEEIIALYRSWIKKKREEIPSLDSNYLRVAAERNLLLCDECGNRMEQGLNYLKANGEVLKAFQLANHAMLLQQVTGNEIREAEVTDSGILFNKPYPELDVQNTTKGKWRAFQIAFILMTLESSSNFYSLDRDTVELIFFPTGGGKTEAYLGLAAFSIFLRRLRDPYDSGVHVIMRYTLRLLTADQFQRASRLICSMDYLRKSSVNELGQDPFSIGIWLGSDTTPNTHVKALADLKALKRGTSEDNPFLVRSCPWCGAQIGKILDTRKNHNIGRKGFKHNNSTQHSIHGYKVAAGTVVIHCSDYECIFHDGLPIYVVDEDIYSKRPTLVIGTVDKFALLAWNSSPRSMFGIDKEGDRFCSPPGLIIQDELHLISGPLGSMTGMFEVLVEELCTDYRSIDNPVRPKIVCSTATIRRFQKQVQDIYAREKTRLFPSPGLEVEDSFFAQNATDQEGNMMPGRKYVGINTPGLGSMQTLQVRSLTALLQGPVGMDENEKDPWWTLLIFFNSLRELGTTVTLLQSDIPNHLKVIKNREGIGFEQLRRLNRIKELTSRLNSDEVSAAINELKTEVKRGAAIDVCLASNIIEVGVDIDRLSLMAVVGQPKTTSQYIQVTGRVGRRWYERPGLVVTLYSASKPRDRSHYEKFRTYHEKLYSQVEPTSVTPFSPSVVDRLLHAVMVGYVRQFGEMSEVDTPRPMLMKLLNQIKNIILKRVEHIDPAEIENVKLVFEKRIAHWEKLNPVEWSKSAEDGNYPLLRLAGEYADERTRRLSWPTPMSLRNVDASCQGDISILYKLEELEGIE